MPDSGVLVVVIEDDDSVRMALARLLDASGFKVATFTSAKDFLSSPRDTTIGCFVLDVRMPGISGLSLHQSLRQSHPTCPVIFLTGHGNIPMAVRAMKDDAFEFLTKPVDEEVLLEAVERALAAHRHRLAEESVTNRAQTLVANLTPRELDVFKHVISGALNKEIAHALAIAEKTVKIHRGNLRAKLGADSVVDLVDLARRAGVEAAHRP